MSASSSVRAFLALKAVLLAAGLSSCVLDERSLSDQPRGELDASSPDHEASAPCSAGCSGNLIENAGFDRDVHAWGAEANVTGSWLGADAAQDPASGCLNLQNGWQGDVPGVVVAGSAQCVPVAENGSYRLEAKVYVVDVGAAGGVDATFYATADCSSAFSSAQRGAALTATRGAWEGLEVLLSTPAGTRSALLRLVVTKELSASAATVRFDDVSLTLR